MGGFRECRPPIGTDQAQIRTPFLPSIVTRVRPGTSKGMTDLLLTHFKDLIGPDPPMKLCFDEMTASQRSLSGPQPG
jgi:hypothetical protein